MSGNDIAGLSREYEGMYPEFSSVSNFPIEEVAKIFNTHLSRGIALILRGTGYDISGIEVTQAPTKIPKFYEQESPALEEISKELERLWQTGHCFLGSSTQKIYKIVAILNLVCPDKQDEKILASITCLGRGNSAEATFVALKASILTNGLSFVDMYDSSKIRKEISAIIPISGYENRDFVFDCIISENLESTPESITSSEVNASDSEVQIQKPGALGSLLGIAQEIQQNKAIQEKQEKQEKLLLEFFLSTEDVLDIISQRLNKTGASSILKRQVEDLREEPGWVRAGKVEGAARMLLLNIPVDQIVEYLTSGIIYVQDKNTSTVKLANEYESRLVGWAKETLKRIICVIYKYEAENHHTIYALVGHDPDNELAPLMQERKDIASGKVSAYLVDIDEINNSTDGVISI